MTFASDNSQAPGKLLQLWMKRYLCTPAAAAEALWASTADRDARLAKLLTGELPVDERLAKALQELTETSHKASTITAAEWLEVERKYRDSL